MSELTDDRLLRYVAMLRHECAYKGPCKDNGDGCTCSAVELDARHMRTLRAAASTRTEGAGVKEQPLRDLLTDMGRTAADPMWSDHVELRKATLQRWIKTVRVALNPPAPKATTDEAEERE